MKPQYRKWISRAAGLFEAPVPVMMGGAGIGAIVSPYGDGADKAVGAVLLVCAFFLAMTERSARKRVRAAQAAAAEAQERADRAAVRVLGKILTAHGEQAAGDMSPEEWIERWARADHDDRVRVAAMILANARAANACFHLNHTGRIAGMKARARRGDTLADRVQDLYYKYRRLTGTDAGYGQVARDLADAYDQAEKDALDAARPEAAR